jgi:hypothetical protein
MNRVGAETMGLLGYRSASQDCNISYLRKPCGILERNPNHGDHNFGLPLFTLSLPFLFQVRIGIDKESSMQQLRQVSLPVAGKHQGYPHPHHLFPHLGTMGSPYKGMGFDTRPWSLGHLAPWTIFIDSYKTNLTVGWYYNLSSRSWATFLDSTPPSWYWGQATLLRLVHVGRVKAFPVFKATAEQKICWDRGGSPCFHLRNEKGLGKTGSVEVVGIPSIRRAFPRGWRNPWGIEDFLQFTLWLYVSGSG